MPSIWNLFEGILEGLVVNRVIWLCGGGVFVIFATLRKYRPTWAPWVLNGFLCVVGVWAIAAFIDLQRIEDKLPSLPPRVTVDVVEEVIKDWAENLGYSILKEEDHDEYYFSYRLTLKNGNHVHVRRTKENDKRLHFGSKLAVSSNHRKAFSGLTRREQILFTSNLGVEVAKLKVAFSTTMPRDMSIQVWTPIGDGLTEHVFLDKVHDVDIAILLTKLIFTREFGQEE